MVTYMRLENKQHKTCRSVFETTTIFSALPSANGFYINGKKSTLSMVGGGEVQRQQVCLLIAEKYQTISVNILCWWHWPFLLSINLNTDTLPVMQLEHRHHRRHCCQKDQSPVQQKHEVVEILLELFLTWAVLYPSITHVVM